MKYLFVAVVILMACLGGYSIFRDEQDKRYRRGQENQRSESNYNNR